METIGEDSGIGEFFGSIEEAFGRLRGRPLLMAPRDVALAKQWYEAGVPLAVVLKALERFFAREARRDKPRRRSPSLEYCEADVFEVWEDFKDSRLGADAAVGGELHTSREEEVLNGHLAAVELRLGRARGGAEKQALFGLMAAIDAVRRQLGRVRAELAGNSLEDLEATFSRADRKLVEAARGELSDEDREQLRDEARREADDIGGGVDERALEVLRRKAEERALRARFDLPRIGLFAF